MNPSESRSTPPISARWNVIDVVMCGIISGIPAYASRGEPKLFIEPNYPNSCDFTWAVSMGRGRSEVLGYNRGEDMELAAKRFCQRYKVSEGIIPQLVHIIKQSTSERYIAHQSTSKDKASQPPADGYPIKVPQLFAGCSSQPEMARKRLQEDNNAQLGLTKLTPREMFMMVECLSSNQLPSPFVFCEGLDRALYQWPIENLLPIIDVLRQALLDESFNSYYFSEKMRFKFTTRLIDILLSDADSNIKYVVFLALCNAFKHPVGRSVLCADGKKWMSVVAKLLPKAKLEHIQIVISKFVGNYAAVLFLAPAASAQCAYRADILQYLVVILSRLTDRHNLFLTGKSAQSFQLATITLMWANDELVTLAKDLGILDVVDCFKRKFSDDANHKLAQQLITMVEWL